MFICLPDIFPFIFSFFNLWNKHEFIQGLKIQHKELISWTISEWVADLSHTTPEYFSYKDILLHNHNTIIKIRKLCPKCLLLEQKDSVQKHEHHLLVKYFLSLSLEQFLIISLTFIIFTLWRLQGSYFVEFPSFGCTSWWDSDYIPWAGVSQKWCCLRLPLPSSDLK